jgi:protein-S-isoprenylcysteine O-methyltransferase Ste14
MLAAIALPPWLGRYQPTIGWIGIAMMAAGLALGLWSRHALGASFTPFPRPVESGGDAVTHGPYRFVRHPMYVAILVAFAGWALVWGSLAGAVATALLLVFFDLKARREERWLEQSYPAYADYRRRVRKFVPLLY